jgi:Domain of unknown function (DUF5050)/Abnormal spindle-like microcephaly-assoc'd, ASPM-SPD-2-Hydin
MAQHRGHGQPRRPKARRRAGAGTKRTTAAAAPTGTGMAGGVFLGQLYWANRGDGTIWQANLDGSSPQALVTGQHDPGGVAVDTTHLYWTNGGDGTIWQANLDGSGAQAIVTGQSQPVGVVVDATHLYWVSNGDNSIWVANLDGSNPKALVTGQNRPFGVTLDTTHLYWTNNGDPESPQADGSIWAANLDGSNPKALVTGQPFPIGVTVDASHLSWANFGDNSIWQANLDGTNPRSLLTGLDGAWGVAVDASHLYWTNPEGTISQANLDGSNPQTLVTGLDNPQLMVVPPTLLGFAPSSYDYGQVTIGQTASQAFTLTNSGGQASGPLTVTLEGPAAFTTTSDGCGATSLGPGQSCTVNVRFAPTSPGTVTATLKAGEMVAPGEGIFVATVTLTGTTEPVRLGFTPSSYDYGQVAVGETASQALTLTNSGG